MIVTIHQPNFIPWYPFFQKMEQADVFILLGHCQFEKNGFQNRFQLENTWNTFSVKKGKESIIEKQYINPELFKYKNILSELDPYINKDLYKTNKDIIIYLKNKLNIKTQIIEDTPTNLASTERLLMLCKKHGATKYLAGQGGKDYLDESLFLNEGIEVIYQENLIKKHTFDEII